MGPQRADLLKKELQVFSFGDLLEHFPFRHIDKTQVSLISELDPQSDLPAGEAGFAQVAGTLLSYETIGQRGGKRLVGQLKDKSGLLELTWFQGLNWVQKTLETGRGKKRITLLSFPS